MSPAQCRAARALLDWSQARLAASAGLDEAALRDFEAGRHDPPSGALEGVRSVLMRAGIVFTNENGQGVRLGGRGHDEGTRLDALTTENDR